MLIVQAGTAIVPGIMREAPRPGNPFLANALAGANGQESRFEVRSSRFEVQGSALDVGSWMFPFPKLPHHNTLRRSLQGNGRVSASSQFPATSAPCSSPPQVQLILQTGWARPSSLGVGWGRSGVTLVLRWYHRIPSQLRFQSVRLIQLHFSAFGLRVLAFKRFSFLLGWTAQALPGCGSVTRKTFLSPRCCCGRPR